MDAPTVLCLLIVDESHEIANLTALFLQTCGYAKAVAYDGEKAFDLATRFCPNAVVLEISLPGIDGFELAHRAGDDAPGKMGSAATTAIIELALTKYLDKHERGAAGDAAR